jgi:hypothetical protein
LAFERQLLLGNGEEATHPNPYRTLPVDVVGLSKVTCTGNTGSITLTPGVTRTSGVQTMKVKALTTGCEGGGFSTVKYTAKLTTAGRVSCATLSEGGGGAWGSARFKWTPKAKPSTASLSLRLSEEPELSFSGERAARMCHCGS